MPISVGLTGGMGAGKSLIAKIFDVLEIPCYDSDYHARRLMVESASLVQSIKKLLGQDAYNAETQLNRAYVASIIFKDALKLEALNQLVHPVVHRDAMRWHGDHPTSPYTIREAALIFESGAYLHLDYVIDVQAPRALRIERVMKRDDLSVEAVNKRLENQWTNAQREMLADFQIRNDGTKPLIPQVLELHRRLCALSELGTKE